MARVAIALAWLIPMCGCPPQPEKIAPRNAQVALERVNDNLAKLDRPVQYKALTSFAFRDTQGRTRRFLGHEASLIFRGPRYLRFDIRSLAGVVAQFGSDDTRYWVWIEPEVRKLWWGYWKNLAQAAPSKLPIPPDDLLDVLMLRPLPEALTGGLHPLLRKVDDDHRLLFVRLGEDGQPTGWREFRLDPQSPYLPREITDRGTDGQIQMHATIERYERIGESGPLVPRRYVVVWPMDHAEMRVDVTKATLRPDLPVQVFDFPSRWPGEVEQIDADADDGLSCEGEDGKQP